MEATIGERIRQARESKHLYQSQLAEIIGVKSAAVISNWENDINKPDAEKIVKLCIALDVSASYLLNYHGHVGDPLSPHEHVHIKKYRALDTHGKDIVDTVIDKELSRLDDQRCLNAPVRIMPIPALRIRRIPLSRQSASAGLGQFTYDTGSDEIEIIDNERTQAADFAVRINGDSMLPRYSDGDIILVSTGCYPNEGDVCIFTLNGETYIKQWQDGILRSLNSAYTDIKLREGDELDCNGKVIGTLNPEDVVDMED